MSDGEDDLIIIKKHRSDPDEEHHGGVWKLAFADFMTAMMAFFLVMWLINSTTKETKASIVQYFNPVQLIDSTLAHKGLRDPKTGGQGKSAQQTSDIDGATGSAAERERQEEALHTQPLKALDTIAKRGLRPEAPPNGATTLSDPFDRGEQNEAASTQFDDDNANHIPLSAVQEATKRPPPSSPATVAATAKGNANMLAALQDSLEKIVRIEATGAKGAPRLEVTQTQDGLLISLTDDTNFSMFAIGSIEPKPQLVRILAQVGRLLAERKGDVEVRGFTDARSYKTIAYDNWRLSSDRATAVNYMLIRGGLAEPRIARTVGYADRSPKAPKEPLAPVNRRIEILLREDAR